MDASRACSRTANSKPGPVLPITPDDSHLMLCGNSDMIKDVRGLLETRGLRRHRRHEPGPYTTEQYH